MKTILFFDAARLGGSPRRLTLPDAVASAFVRAGIAAAADPVDAGALSAGAALAAATPTSVTIEHGLPGLGRMVRLNVPLSVAHIAVAAGAAAIVTPPFTASFFGSASMTWSSTFSIFGA